MCGCVNPAAISISRRNRSALTVDDNSPRSTLIATRRLCRRSFARTTNAMPPLPISRSMTYRPASGCSGLVNALRPGRDERREVTAHRVRCGRATGQITLGPTAAQPQGTQRAQRRRFPLCPLCPLWFILSWNDPPRPLEANHSRDHEALELATAPDVGEREVGVLLIHPLQLRQHVRRHEPPTTQLIPVHRVVGRSEEH